jgi:hypothetical protein
MHERGRIMNADREWGVRFRREHEPHRWGMTEAEARSWIQEAEGEDKIPVGVFVLISRELGPWTDRDDAPWKRIGISRSEWLAAGKPNEATA